MKSWAQSLLEDARALISKGRRAHERFGVPVPAFLQSDLSPRTLELFAEARAIGGAYRFHQWAASQLPPNVRAHYGERFVLGAHHLLADNFPSLSVAHNLFDPKPEPTVLLDCPLCSCKTDDGKRADCLIRRFHNAFESITSEGIAEWYSGLDGLAAKDVRAFFRGAAPTHPPIREAFGQILTEELLQREGLQVNVNVKGKQTPPRKTLRDAFALTAMVRDQGMAQSQLHGHGCLRRVGGRQV